MSAFLCTGTPEYGWMKKLQALEPIDYDNFLRRSHAAREKLPATHAELNGKDSIWLHDVLMDGEDLSAFSDVGIEVTCKRVKGLSSNSPAIHQTLYQISVANVGLLQIIRVEVLEDACTDDLQGYLDRGWRILAVCPPNDARRPSYVMGHTDKRAD